MAAASLLTATPTEAFAAAASATAGSIPDDHSGAAALLAQARSLELKVRRLPDAVEVVIEGAGAAPELQQATSGNTWQGRLITPVPTRLRRGNQSVSLPEAGLETIRISGGGREYRLEVSAAAGFSAPKPVVSSDGRDLILTFEAPNRASLQIPSPNLGVPGRVPQPGYVPPLQPRAVAPPVGDMAVGTMMLANPSYVNVSGPPVTMTLNQAPAKDVLMALSRLGGYGFVFVDDAAQPASAGAAGSGGASAAALRPISIAFQGETYSRAVNSALLAAGLQGKLEGNMILAGPNVLGKTFGAQMSKVYRLNQASAGSAADYLANLGATITKTFTTTAVTSDIQSAGTAQVGSATQTSATATTTQVEAFGASQGPLRGLIGTTDSRLGTITLVGDPRLVAIAENYLRQLDLRQRQVALAVKVIDVSLDNAQEIANSFAFRWGNNFIVNDDGRVLGAFGSSLPPQADAFNRALPPVDEDITLDGESFEGPSNVEALGTIDARGTNTIDGVTTNQSGRIDARGSINTIRRNPSLNYPRDNFFDFIQAQIVSRSAKVLASPTIILQENPAILREGGATTSTSSEEGGLDEYSIDSPIGRRRANEAAVRVGTNVITDYDVTTSEFGTIICEPTLTTAGLVLGARVEKIDDNGFVTFSLSPSISAVTDREPSDPNCGGGFINILSVRRLDTGSLRVRDGQTLILTGVISDSDVAEVSKWPILGDIPIIGQFFRATNNRREKRELVILVTPRVIDDEQGGTFGYGYQPSNPSTLRMLNR